MTRDLAMPCDGLDCEFLLADWRWQVPEDHHPLLLGAFGDWILGAPDGSLWNLSLLEGDYRQIASSSEEFGRLKDDIANLESWFLADWFALAQERGLVPNLEECLGWKVHPILGAAISVENLEIFPLRVYQRLMGQLFRQVRLGSGADASV